MQTKKNVKELNFIKQTIEKRINAELAGANDLAAKLAACEIKIVKKVGDEGKLFGSVTAREISDALKEKGFDVDHRSLVLDSNIKKSGVYEVEVKLFRGVRGVFKLWVVSDESERQEENEPETAPVEE